MCEFGDTGAGKVMLISHAWMKWQLCVWREVIWYSESNGLPVKCVHCLAIRTTGSSVHLSLGHRRSSYLVWLLHLQRTGYGLDGPGIESRWGARFSAPVLNGPGAHPASCTRGTGSFPGGKERPGRDADPSLPSTAVGHERVELYLYSPYG